MTYVRDPRAVPCTGGTLGAGRVEAIRLKWLEQLSLERRPVRWHASVAPVIYFGIFIIIVIINKTNTILCHYYHNDQHHHYCDHNRFRHDHHMHP